MEEIVLREPDICHMSCSEQLRSHGIAVSDSNFKAACKSIFALFAEEASSNYEEVEQGVYDLNDPRRWCDLCGNRDVITYYRVKNTTGEPIRTVHAGKKYAFNFVLTWPNTLKLGTSCIKLLNVCTNKSKMFDSMVYGHHPFELTQNGLILTGRYLLTKNEMWTNNQLIIPHALFTILPEFAYKETNAEIYSLNNSVELNGCTENALRRSFFAASPNAKYGIYQRMTDILVRTEFCGTDKAFPNLVTIMTQDDAEKVLKIFRNRR